MAALRARISPTSCLSTDGAIQPPRANVSAMHPTQCASLHMLGAALLFKVINKNSTHFHSQGGNLKQLRSFFGGLDPWQHAVAGSRRYKVTVGRHNSQVMTFLQVNLGQLLPFLTDFDFYDDQNKNYDCWTWKNKYLEKTSWPIPI